MDKVLFTASIDEHLIGFHLPFIDWFVQAGFEVHAASSGESIIPGIAQKYNIGFERTPLRWGNMRAYGQLKQIMAANQYKVIHCHTPMASILTRLAAISSRRKGTKVIYTAHGFHFFKNAPKLNWMIYYPTEKIMSYVTDCLNTINREDYGRAVKKLHAKRIELVHGVGVDLNVFTSQTQAMKDEKRQNYGYPQEAFIMIYAGELSYRKHQDLLIDAMTYLKNEEKKYLLLLAGKGPYDDRYRSEIVKNGLQDHVLLLGRRNDIAQLMTLADIAISASRQEGLPVNIMEGMATGLPLIATDCRGNRDLVTDGENGYVIGIEDAKSCADVIRKMASDEEARWNFSQNNIRKIKKYALESVLAEMADIYKSFI